MLVYSSHVMYNSEPGIVLHQLFCTQANNSYPGHMPLNVAILAQRNTL